MPDTSTQSILVDAPPAAVMAVIADFEHYPVWAASVCEAAVAEVGPDGRAREVDFHLDAGVIVDRYRLRYVWDGDRRVEWDLVSGDVIRAQHGSYTLVPRDGGTEVTYALAVDLSVPMLGRLRRKAERMVLDTALRELKRRVETLRADA
ncbi:MAG: SRPBCC family protein [Jatrophihabitans sp.]|uniref:SRPBCC family protein n=1 Tax=Jatrophihabitans sp. TaxID=1932789 RepID=UPI003F7E9A18